MNTHAIKKGKSAVISFICDAHMHTEILDIIAATGREVISIDSPEDIDKYIRHAYAIIMDIKAIEKCGQDYIEEYAKEQRIILVLPDISKEYRGVKNLEKYRIPAQSTELLQNIGRADGTSISNKENNARIIGILGAVGGVGTSTFAAALAWFLREKNPILLDGSMRSGGLDLLLGLEEKEGARWEDINFDAGDLNPQDVRAALIQEKGLSLLTHARGAVDYAQSPAQDIPPSLNKALRTLSADNSLIICDLSYEEYCFREIFAQLDMLILLVPLEVRAVASAHAMIMALRAQKIEPLVVTCNRTWSGLDAEDLIASTQVTVIGHINYSARIAKNSEILGIKHSSLPRSYKKLFHHIMKEAGCG